MESCPRALFIPIPSVQKCGEYLDADSALTFLLPISAETPTTPPGSRQGRYHYFHFTDVETEALGEGHTCSCHMLVRGEARPGPPDCKCAVRWTKTQEDRSERLEPHLTFLRFSLISLFSLIVQRYFRKFWFHEEQTIANCVGHTSEPTPENHRTYAMAPTVCFPAMTKQFEFCAARSWAGP